MNVTAIVVDDEPLARSRLKRLLMMQDVNVVAEGQNGQEAVDLVLQHNVDMLFIDINMPIKTGMQAVKEISEKINDLPAIVFCTAYDKHAIEAFQTDAVAYLLKPIQGQDIASAITKAASVNKFQRENLFEKEVGNKTLTIHYDGALQNMPINRFLFFKSESKNVFAILDNGHEILMDATLKSLEESFARDFIRIHRAILMNKQQVSRLVKNETGAFYIELRDGDFQLPVSRRHLSEVKKCF